MTYDDEDVANPLKDNAPDNACQSVAKPVESVKWAVQDLNTPTKTRGKPHISKAGAAKSAASESKSADSDTADGNFAEALVMIARLPLSDAEKAEAVRRLLEAKAHDKTA